MSTDAVINPPREAWKALLMRPEYSAGDLDATVSAILSEVKTNKDQAIKHYNATFDKYDGSIEVTPGEIAFGVQAVNADLKAAIDLAKNNIETFHLSQLHPVKRVETMPGVICWRENKPIEKVGLYIPGGTAPLFSTLLMLGIPALIAGCTDITVCTPAGADGNISPVILYTASLLGINKIYKVGGAQAIAAMAYGTETINPVYKIFGPGNQFVTAAKKIISAKGVAIDMPAGPSEVAVYADLTADADFVAADLLSQAEHGTDSQVLLVASSVEIINAVKISLEQQLANLPRREIAATALSKSIFIVMHDIDLAFDMLNEYAPEHLIISTDDSEKLSAKVSSAGSVFLGHFAPEAAGDYASGTNHTLPTNGFAKAYSGVSVDSFVKKITFQKLGKQGLQNLGKAVEIMAGAEGLDAHKNAISVRLKKINNQNGI